MRTIKCVFTDVAVSLEAAKTMKQYTYNTEEPEIKVGDLLSSSNYKRNIQVVGEYKDSFTYVNLITGGLKNTYENSKDVKIKRFVLGEIPSIVDPDCVYVKKV